MLSILTSEQEVNFLTNIVASQNAYGLMRYVERRILCAQYEILCRVTENEAATKTNHDNSKPSMIHSGKLTIHPDQFAKYMKVYKQLTISQKHLSQALQSNIIAQPNKSTYSDFNKHTFYPHALISIYELSLIMTSYITNDIQPSKFLTTLAKIPTKIGLKITDFDQYLTNTSLTSSKVKAAYNSLLKVSRSKQAIKPDTTAAFFPVSDDINLIAREHTVLTLLDFKRILTDVWNLTKSGAGVNLYQPNFHHLLKPYDGLNKIANQIDQYLQEIVKKKLISIDADAIKNKMAQHQTALKQKLKGTQEATLVFNRLHKARKRLDKLPIKKVTSGTSTSRLKALFKRSNEILSSSASPDLKGGVASNPYHVKLTGKSRRSKTQPRQKNVGRHTHTSTPDFNFRQTRSYVDPKASGSRNRKTGSSQDKTPAKNIYNQLISTLIEVSNLNINTCANKLKNVLTLIITPDRKGRKAPLNIAIKNLLKLIPPEDAKANVTRLLRCLEKLNDTHNPKAQIYIKALNFKQKIKADLTRAITPKQAPRRTSP